MVLKSGLSIILLFSLVLSQDSPVEETIQDEDSNVLVVTDTTFTNFVSEHNKVLLEFYAPWCGHCKQLAPQYEQAANIAVEEEIPFTFAKVDATENEVLSKSFGIEGFPTLLYFEDGKLNEKYERGRTTKDLVNYAKDKALDPFTRMTPEEVSEYLEAQDKLLAEEGVEAIDAPYLVIGRYPKTSNKLANFMKLCKKMRHNDDFKFILVESGKRAVVQYHRTILKDDVLGDGEIRDLAYRGKMKHLKQYLFRNKYPLLLGMSDGDFITRHPMELLFQEIKVPRKGLIYIKKPENEDYSLFNQRFLRFCDEQRKRGYQCVWTDKDWDDIGFSQGINGMIATRYLIKRGRNILPHLKERYKKDPYLIRKYRLDGDATETNLRQFVEDVEENRLEVYRKSENADSLTVDPNNNFAELVADTLDNYIYNTEYDTLVAYYEPNCSRCEDFFVLWNKLGSYIERYYTSKGKLIRLARINVKENDVDEIVGETYVPHVVLYPAGTVDIKGGKPYNDDKSNLDLFVDYIDAYARSLNKGEL